MLTFQLSYDYRCPFAKNIHLHVLAALRAGADFAVTFVPWTLSHDSAPAGSLDVWDDPARDSELLALAVSVSIRDQQPEYFLDAHEALFRARHERAIRLVTTPDIEAVLNPTGVDLEKVSLDLSSRRPHEALRKSVRDFEHYGAFGVPTFVVGEDATFVRYMNPPSSRVEESVALIETLVNLMRHQSPLNEFKHTKVPL